MKRPTSLSFIDWFVRACVGLCGLFWLATFPSCVVGDTCPSPQTSCKTPTDCPGSRSCQNGCCASLPQEPTPEIIPDFAPEPTPEPARESNPEGLAETTTESNPEPTKPTPCRADAECPKEFPDCRAGECIKLCDKSEVCLPTFRCSAGYCQPCENGTRRDAIEQCNNLDDNCDGQIDEGLSQPCYSGAFGCKLEAGKYTCLGGCQSGTQICQNGQWQTCVGESLPQPETCDGKDNDCDGLIDDTHNCVSTLATSVQIRDFAFNTKGQIFATIGAQIHLYNPQKKAFETFSGSTVGTQDGPPLQAQFTEPQSITIDPQGNLYVVDNRKLRKLDPTGNVSTLVIPPELVSHLDFRIFHHPAGFLYILQGTSLYVHNLATKQTKTLTYPFQAVPSDWNLDPITQALYVSFHRNSGRPTLVLPSPLDKAFLTNTSLSVPFAIDHEGRILEAFPPSSSNLAVGLRLHPGSVALSDTTTPCRTATTKCYQDGPLDKALFGNIRQIVALPDGAFLLYDSDNQALRKVTRPAPDACAQVNTTRTCYTGPADTAKIGSCKDGEQTCTHDGWSACAAQKRPSPELCNNQDDNCNGQIDEDIPSAPPCAKQQGSCQYSVQSCKNGAWSACQDADYLAQNNKYATTEICDGYDNDCNGLIDEGVSDCINSLPIQNTSPSTALYSVVADAQGNLYFTDGHAIRKYDSKGQITTLAGSPTSSSSADGTGTQARFNSPRGLTVAGNLLYIADFSNHRIRQIDLTTLQVTTLAGSGTPGRQDGTAAQAQFSNPSTLALGPGNLLYVGEAGNLSIRRITLSASPAVDTLLHNSNTSTSSIGTARQFAFHPSRNMLVIASSHGLHTFDVNSRSFNNILTNRSDILAVAARPNGDIFYATRYQITHLGSAYQELQKTLDHGARGGIPGNFANASFVYVYQLSWTPQGQLLINDGGHNFDRWQP